MTDRFSLTNRTALVTGGGRGIGLVLARGLAAAGARVVVNDIDPERVREAVAGLREDGHDAFGAPFDVTNGEQVDAGVRRAQREAGPVDVLVNNAGIHRRAPLLEMSEQDWRAVLETNLTAAFIVGKRVARDMIDRRRGKIINISSINCERPRPSIANYCAAKAGLVQLTRSMTVEWAKHNIQANAIAPGYMLTELTMPLHDDPEKNAWIESITPAGRWGDPDDLVGPAVFLASDASAFVNGAVLFVDGGMMCSL